MRSLSISATLSLVLTFGFLASSVSAETINNNLTIGSRGAEVSTLQQFLVAEGYLVMPLGVSYGYFGPLTRSAVVSWQRINGISPALGFFGSISRGVFATKLPTTSPVVPNEPATLPTLPSTPPSSINISVEEDSPRAPGMRAGRIMLFRASPFEVRPGDPITLDGSGFSKTLNKVYFNGSNSVIATSTNGVVMNVVVPASVSNGEHELSVENVWGSSANPDIKIKIKVTNNPEPPPTITSVSISGDTVTVVGTGFTSSNNLFTTLGDTSSSISSNGTTFTFHITDLSRYEQTKKFTQGKYQVALLIFVQNDHGMNKDPYQLNITL